MALLITAANGKSKVFSVLLKDDRIDPFAWNNSGTAADQFYCPKALFHGQLDLMPNIIIRLHFLYFTVSLIGYKYDISLWDSN